MADQWRGEPIDELIERVRIERGMSQYTLADALGRVSGRDTVDRNYVSRWEKRKRIPTPYWRRHLSTVLHVPLEVLDRAAAVAGTRRAAVSQAGSLQDASWETTLCGVVAPTGATEAETGGASVLGGLTDEVIDFAGWVEQTNVGDLTIDYLAGAVRRLAVEYLQKPPGPILAEATALCRRLCSLLREGRQHLRQTRELYVIAGRLLAFVSWASSDLGRPGAADAYARTGWILAEQADHDSVRALVLTAQSKNAFWERRYHDAAALACRGQQYAPATEARVLLACQEGDAWQALGDTGRAVQAHAKARASREAIAHSDGTDGIWGCGQARQANYAMGVKLRATDAAGALRLADAARQAYARGEPFSYGTGAQIRIGAGIAQMMAGELEAAAAEFAPIFALPPHQRLATFTARLGEVDRWLGHRRYSGSPRAHALREQLADYRADTITTRALTAGRR